MFRRLTLGVAAALAMGATSTVVAQPMMRPGMADPAMGVPTGPALPTFDYVAAVERSDMFEVAEARMALGRTANPEVRDFAQTMIRDQAKSTAMIAAALEETGHPAPPPPTLDPDQRRMIATLRRAGPDFGRIYLDQQVQADMKALEVHAAYARGGQNLALQRTANRTVPVIRRHLALAHDIRTRLG